MRRIRATSILLASVALAACGEAPPPAPTASPKNTSVAPADSRFRLVVSGQELRVRLALTELELAKGLMHTKSLPDDEGMLFLYRDDDRRAFWMMNVPYDIDAGYFTADGALDEIVRLRANDPSAVPSDSEKIRYVLEAPAGWFDAKGLKRGSKLDLTAVANAVSARGFRAADFVPPAKPRAD